MSDQDHASPSPASTDADIRLLRQIVDEAREEPPPPVDWDTVEARLLARVQADDASRRRQAKAAPRWGALAGFAAAAAAVVMLVAGVGGDNAEPNSGAVTPTVVAHDDLVAVPRGADEPALYTVVGMKRHSAIESGAEPMRFTLPGVVTWTLAPHSRVVLETIPVAKGAATMPHVVRLEQGRLEAEVIPRQDSDQLLEAFVVEAGTTRVAVHGTLFSVERRADIVDVEVTRGSVTVGPAHHRGVTTGHLMVSPKRASFRAGEVVRGDDAEKPLAMADEPESSDAPASEPARPGALAAEADEPSTPGEVAKGPEPTPSTANGPDDGSSDADDGEDDDQADDTNDDTNDDTDAPLTVAAAAGRVVSCLASAAPEGAATGTKVTVSSQVTAVLSPIGEVVSVQFVPPLRPDLQQRCAGVLFGQRIEGTGKVSFPVQLKAD